MTESGIATILIVDDKESNIFALEKLLEHPERTFMHAADGNEALKTALKEEIDLIILDVQMPGMDGFEVAQVLKSNKKTRDVPIIFASAEKKEKTSIMKGFEEGAVDYLFKPLDPELTKAKVAVLLKIQKQKKELIEKNILLENAKAEINQLNTDLQNKLLQLEALNKELESFSYSVSHDLRAPLRSITGYARMLEEDYLEILDGKGKKTLSTIRHNADRMNTLIDELLRFSRLGRKELEKSNFDAGKLVDEVINEIKVTYPNNAEIKFQNDLPDVCGDSALLRQVWFNLLSNAVKYSSKKEYPVIEIGSERNQNGITFHVRDNGAGFKMEYVSKLFGVFQRLHRTSDFDGIGVGLALVERIVSKHGGKVWAQGKENEGAVFYFSLPDESPVLNGQC